MPINDDLFVTDTHMSVFENNNDQCPDFWLAQASCAIKVLCDREQKGLRSITISLDDCYWPILLKKSAIVCASEKYASEIEIFTVGRGFPDSDFT